MIDYRDEFYVRLYRCWLVVSILGQGKSGHNILSIRKAAFFDFLVRNPRVLHDFLVKFGRLKEAAPYKDILYSSNIDYGAFQDYQDFLRSALVLEVEGYVRIVRCEGDFFVESTDKRFDFDGVGLHALKMHLELLKPLVKKSLSVLYKGVLK